MIEVVDLRKRFGDVVAVDGIGFTAEPGAIFGLLGPNGAGKSTTIGCISGLLTPSEGTVRVMGRDVAAEGPAARERLGVVPQELALYEDLGVRENLSYWGAAYGLGGDRLRERVDRVLDLIELTPRAGDRVENLSGGLKRRVNFGCGIVHEPAVLLLDEPTVGVDPQTRARLLDLVVDLARAGTCILYTTHYMEEAERLCDRLAIIDHGRIIAAGTLPELRAMVGERDVLRLSGEFAPDAVVAALRELSDLDVVQAEAGALTLTMPQASSRLSDVFAALARSGAAVQETTLTRPSLETLFIKMTGKGIRE